MSWQGALPAAPQAASHTRPLWSWAAAGFALGLAGAVLAFIPQLVGLVIVAGSIVERRRSPSFGRRLLPVGLGLVSGLVPLVALAAVYWAR